MPHRVLCIEGNEATRSRVKAILEARGFAVDTSESGLDGITRALARPPDLVVADVHLPDIEGFELAAMHFGRGLDNLAFYLVPVIAYAYLPGLVTFVRRGGPSHAISQRRGLGREPQLGVVIAHTAKRVFVGKIRPPLLLLV